MERKLYEQELQAQVEAELDAWNNRDIEKLLDTGWTRGYGFRSIDPRTEQNFTPEVSRQILEGFFNSLEHYRIIPGEYNIVFDGDIALTWGYHIEEIKHKEKPAERLRVRSSATLRRTKEGDWRTLLSHRDIQQFDENGRYIPRYE